MSRRSRLRNQDGFIRGLVWMVLILAVISVVILDGMAVFNAYQTAGDGSGDAAQAGLTEYAQTTNVAAAKAAAEERAAKGGLEIVKFSVARSSGGGTVVTVTSTTTAETYAFRYLGMVPQLKDWVERTTHPVRTNTAE